MIKHLLAASLLVMALPTLAEPKGPKHSPPGLAKKNPACVPPGQAKKGATYSDDRDDYVKEDRYSEIRVGDRVVLDGQEYVVVASGDTVVLRRNDTIYRLPRIGDGSDYVRVGNVIVKVDRKTDLILSCSVTTPQLRLRKLSWRRPV